jgi:MscS family membrane protein
MTTATARSWAAVARSALLVSLSLPVLAQPAAQKGQPPPPVEAHDPLGRDTPRGTITGFNQAVHRKDFVGAAQYLQATAAQRRNAETLAGDLTELIDRYYLEPITSISDEPDGTPSDGLPLDRERIVLRMESKPVEIELVRVKDRQAGLVWLISSQTLTRVPALFSSADDTWLERLMPQTLVERTAFGIPMARWIALAATFVIPFAALWLLSAVVIALSGRIVTNPARRRILETWHWRLRWLVLTVLALVIHLSVMRFLGFSLRFRAIYIRIVLVVLVVALAGLLWRIMVLSFARARAAAQQRGQAGIRSVLLLAERVCKTVLVLAVIFTLLTIAGVDTTTALAGVGLGGVAIALGAQKSVENLLGGVFLITDRALAVGDFCSISNRVGVVEDITMRSIRLRTVEQTLLSVPAGILSQSTLENFATREKILIQNTLRLRYGTTAQQLRCVLNEIRTLLEAHPAIETSTARIRLVDFSVRAIELELFAYALTADWLEFLALREEMLLQVVAIIESSGTRFAEPMIVSANPSVAASPGPPAVIGAS